MKDTAQIVKEAAWEFYYLLVVTTASWLWGVVCGAGGFGLLILFGWVK